MYLSKSERKEIMALYGHESAVDKEHYQVEPDTWVYLFEENGKKYLLIDADYLGDFEFDIFPHLLKFENDEFTKLEFVLQREVPAISESSNKKALNTILFEYTS
ncbi:MAG: hypothetical protein Q4B87_01725 [Candidatus Saccharibacteria bacterium]|nr:hypothetical protein [Candidatus Saccharibacteria bacterium]